MNEQRQQDYLKLIQSLLDSPSGEEEILAAHQDLLDVGFVHTVEELAQIYSQHGNENTANWLQNLASYLKEVLNLDNQVDLQFLSEEEIEAYFQFVGEVLQATADSKGNPQVVYPLLAQNTDKLDGVFAQILRRLETNTLREVKADAKFIAEGICDFSNLIQQFPFGNKASNMEIAITGYKVVLEVYTREAFPQDWAMIKNNLANAYSDRIKGDKADNIENAIKAYTAALTVRTREALPQQWAATQNNLAIAYSDRIKGDKADNIEKAIAAFTAALTVYKEEALPQNWAMTQNNLAIAYRDRIQGDKADNIEKAIAALTAALTVRTREALPTDWAATQNNLAIAYSDRIKGDKAENIENAIKAYTAALTVYKEEALPQNWATTQNNLANAYRDRIQGDKADNIEKAIAAFTAALTVYKEEALPTDWAMTQNNLAIAYRERIKGDKADNIEKAIAASTAALTVRTREALPTDWAATQNNLAIAYWDRIKGDKADNIEKAIASYNAALIVRTREAFPTDWADTQNNLANAYRERIKGDKANNIEKAIASYNAALIVRTREALPIDWAMTQNNLANAYYSRIKGDRAENIDQAIASYNTALTVNTREAFLQNWSMTQNNLGLAYSHRIKGDKADNIENAIAASTAALTVYTREAFPQNWAATQNNLAIAYYSRIKGDRAENIDQAIAAYTAALTVFTREALPENHAQSLFGLGITYQDANKFVLAYNTFESAIATVESLREEIVSGEESKRKQAEHFNNVYSRMVEVCWQLNKITEAIEYVERSKTRYLVEQILERDSKTIFPPEVVTQLEQYRDEIAVGQYQIQNGKAENPQVLAKHLQELRQQRNELQNQYLPVGYGFKFDSFQPTLNEHTAIIEWYILNDKILAFIVTKQGDVTVWQSQLEDREALGNWINQYLQNYYNQKDQWLNNLGEELNKLASILHIDEILNQIPKHCDQLILIPHTFLHLFPLHAIPVNRNSENPLCLLDLFAGGVSYAPSCQLLQQVQKRKRPNFQSLFAIQNPTEDLYQDYEKDLGAVSAIKKQFTDNYVLKQANAKKAEILHHDENTKLFTLNEKLAQANNIFFFCHGFFNPNSSLDSGLQLADENITLADIISHFKLNNCRLVTLSACETGVIDSNNVSDEYIGLPYGFLLAGSTNVVSSLWTVSATATALLMIKFYEELQTQSSIAIALNTTQRWLRDTTAQGFQDWLKNSQLSKAWQRELDKYFAQNYSATTKPFESPFYWSAFFVTGKGV
ncbi:CHAT domain-containing tetratricopeptide repeat protein [Rivularia sp. UHCC 0363]|uniref:CHAT domain-containing tetratricopeptide repeat protein n=1 Tax=Rivularia sp. UHCC 0363 TaxID=3110244 RepID=UPI002B2140A4|nr:CHAT domain-containing protein [Rivularia sp. UHCC 0363]MEA5594765.1 CHAT domain-containing protein [Rivularia sp. UHCC 0363]